MAKSCLAAVLLLAAGLAMAVETTPGAGLPKGVEVTELRTEYSRTVSQGNGQLSTEIHAELWAIAEELARATPDSVVLGLYIDSLNQTIDLHATRATAIVYARVPETVLILLILGAALTLGTVGYSAGLTRRRSLPTAAVLVVVLAAVLTLVVDLDRPRDGFLQVSQQPLIDLQDQIGSPSP